MHSAKWQPATAPTFWINHASRLVMREFERRLRPLALGFAYLPVLMALEEHGELLQKELAERAHVEQPSMAALLARMERDGIVARAPHPDDKRASRIALTRRGKARLPSALQALSEGVEQALRGFSRAERATLIELLSRVVSNLDPQ
jgi:DNA-binding MarR family transcriptional regulator